MVRSIFLEIAVPSLTDFLRMLAAPRPPPSLKRSRKDFSTVAVRIASFGTVLSDSYSFMMALPSLLANPLLSCSEFLGHGAASEILVLLVLLGVRRLACTLLVRPLLATLLAHVRSMRLAFRLHATLDESSHHKSRQGHPRYTGAVTTSCFLLWSSQINIDYLTCLVDSGVGQIHDVKSECRNQKRNWSNRAMRGVSLVAASLVWTWSEKFFFVSGEGAVL